MGANIEIESRRWNVSESIWNVAEGVRLSWNPETVYRFCALSSGDSWLFFKVIGNELVINKRFNKRMS